MSADKKNVTVEYSIKNAAGEELDHNREGPPLTLTIGEGVLLPALETVIETMQVDEEKVVTLAPEEAYGEVHPDAYEEIALTDLPEDARQVGMILGLQEDSGEPHQVRVHAIEGDKAVLDFNHPLAGETLTFQIKLLSVD